MPKATKKAKTKKRAKQKETALQKLDTMLKDARQTAREDLEQIAARIQREARNR